MTDQGPNGEWATRNWEEFMVEAKVAWRVREEERSGRQARIICEGSNEDKETKDQAVDLPDTPSVYEWDDGMSIEEVTFHIKETEGKEVPTITELCGVV